MGAIRAGAKRAEASTRAMAIPKRTVKRGLFMRDMSNLLVVCVWVVGVDWWLRCSLVRQPFDGGHQGRREMGGGQHKREHGAGDDRQALAPDEAVVAVVTVVGVLGVFRVVGHDRVSF